MSTPADISIGSFIRFNGEIVKVVELQHRTPGNLRAFYQAKMKNIKTGKSAENRFRPDEKIEVVRVETRDLQYLYKESDDVLVCMDNTTFEQHNIPGHLFGDALQFMQEGMQVQVAFEDVTPLDATAPSHVVLEITYTEPGVKGDTATNTLKPATVETGATVNVPLFVDNGEKIRIDTRTGQYVERVK